MIRAIIDDFASNFAPGSVLVYAGDTGEKSGYFDAQLLSALDVDSYGQMPDVILYDVERNRLFLIEVVTGHGPIDAKRRAELSRFFATAKAGLIYVNAFQSRTVMARYLSEIAWETVGWVVDSPSHLIHFNGEVLLGSYR